MPRLEWIVKNLGDRWDHLFRQHENADPFRVTVVVTPSAYFDRLRAPFELRYAIDHHPKGFEMVRSFLSEGKGIAILRAPRTQRDVREAGVRLAKTQSSIVDPWLARLIFHEELPVIDTISLDEARRAGSEPYSDARLILTHRVGMIRFAIVDLNGKGVSAQNTEWINELNRVIEPLSASYLYYRLNEDWPKKTIRFISVVLRVCALAFILKWMLPYSYALTFLIAGLADDVARQIGSLISLRFAGYTKRQIKNVAIPYLIPLMFGIGFSLYSATQYLSGHELRAGFLFGLAISSFPLFHMIRRFTDVRKTYRHLEKEGKLFEDARKSPTTYTLYELRRHQAEWGLMIGAIVTPFFCALIFSFLNGIVLNIWTLAICPVIDVLFAIAWQYAMRFSDRARFIAGVMSRMNKKGVGGGA